MNGIYIVLILGILSSAGYIAMKFISDKRFVTKVESRFYNCLSAGKDSMTCTDEEVRLRGLST